MLSEAALTHWEIRRPRKINERGTSTTADGREINLEENLKEDPGLVGVRGGTGL